MAKMFIVIYSTKSQMTNNLKARVVSENGGACFISISLEDLDYFYLPEGTLMSIDCNELAIEKEMNIYDFLSGTTLHNIEYKLEKEKYSVNEKVESLLAATKNKPTRDIVHSSCHGFNDELNCINKTLDYIVETKRINQERIVAESLKVANLI